VTAPVLAADSSALIAILNKEPEAKHFLATLDASEALLGWPTVLEVRIWSVRGLNMAAEPWFQDWLEDPGTQIVPFDGELERLATLAYDRFGKGRHRASLNFGDCMAYAVARHHDVLLLFKGSDFGRTDLKVDEASVVTA
jgi:ribonuclease VapC